MSIGIKASIYCHLNDRKWRHFFDFFILNIAQNRNNDKILYGTRHFFRFIFIFRFYAIFIIKKSKNCPVVWRIQIILELNSYTYEYLQLFNHKYVKLVVFARSNFLKNNTFFEKLFSRSLPSMLMCNIDTFSYFIFKKLNRNSENYPKFIWK